MTQYVLYKRVSTKEQGNSGLGLDAQTRDINIYLVNYAPSDYQVIAEFVEIGSGAAKDRPELDQALALARKTGATLLVAKLDRLSRRVSFTAQLMEDKNVTFRVAVMPMADKFQLHIYAALAEQERQFISDRTKAAMAAAKRKGIKLGGIRPKTAARNAATKAAKLKDAEFLKSQILPAYNRGESLQQLAWKLSDLGYKTRTGKDLAPTQVRRILLRLQNLPLTATRNHA